MRTQAGPEMGQKGVTLILTVAMMGVILPIVGLAVDASLLYAIKARLSAAADAGSLAGARSLNRGIDLASQAASATSTATAFFNADFPTGYLMTTNRTLTVAVAESAYRTRTVRLDASVDAPAYFMRMLGFGSTTVRVAGMASRRDVNVILVLDRSASLTTAGACDDLRAASTGFVDKFAQGRDRVGLITYGGSSRLDYAPSFNFKTDSPNPTTLIAALLCNGATGSAQALWQGYQELVTINEPGALNVLLFFTDGQPNAITAQFPVKTQTTTYSPTGKSTCLDEAGRSNSNPAWSPGPKLGFINVNVGIDIRGVRIHLAPTIPVSVDPGKIANSSGCYFASDLANAYKDIAYAPDTDYYGTSLWGYKTALSTYSSGPYAGKLKISSETTMVNASINAVDNAAQRIRQNVNLAVVVYAIGLGGAGEAEHELLRRVSNDPQSPIYDNTKPAGFYVYSPTPSQLNEAFAKVASEILRLAL